MSAAPDPERRPQRHEVTVDSAETGQRLDRLLAERLGGLSRSRLKSLIEAGMVSAGGATITEPSTRVKPGQTFAIVIPESAPAAPEGQALALHIVYEDSDIIVIDKAAGMVVHPAPGNPGYHRPCPGNRCHRQHRWTRHPRWTGHATRWKSLP